MSDYAHLGKLSTSELQSQYLKHQLANQVKSLSAEVLLLEQRLQAPEEGEQMVRASEVRRVAQQLKDDEGYCEVVDQALRDIGIEPVQYVDTVITVEIHAKAKVKNMENGVDDFVLESLGVDTTRNGNVLDIDLIGDSDIEFVDSGDTYITKVTTTRTRS